MAFSILSKTCIKLSKLLKASHLQSMKSTASSIQYQAFSKLYYSMCSNFISFSIKYLLQGNYEVRLFSDNNYGSVLPSLRHRKSPCQYFFSVLKKERYQPFNKLRPIAVRSFLFFNCK